ncbi:MAG TPA: dethiobiotin synthase, partial [Dehalococcoidia bacterium]|nr:dethiobiotin synthase [Dehalococcoidia bacterium]
MGVLLVSAHRSGTGKTSLIAALLTQMAANGQRVAYYKPFSASPGNDADV